MPAILASLLLVRGHWLIFILPRWKHSALFIIISSLGFYFIILFGNLAFIWTSEVRRYLGWSSSMSFFPGWPWFIIFVWLLLALNTLGHIFTWLNIGTTAWSIFAQVYFIIFMTYIKLHVIAMFSWTLFVKGICYCYRLF